MNVGDWLAQAAKKLEKEGIATARLDCLVLLEDATSKDRSWLLAHSEHELTSEQVDELASKLERRIKHEPLAYIRGKSEFYGREFLVNDHTLEPRPETETMVQLLLDLVKSEKRKVKSIVDVGTGSGCIAITLKLEVPELTVIGTDISEECIKVAEKNAVNLGANISLYRGNLLRPLQNSKFKIQNSNFIILANLPYVPNDFTINQAAMQEPKLAIFGGVDGLDLYRELFEQLQNSKFKGQKPKYILTESLPTQHHTLATIARHYDYTLEKTEDFIQLFSLG